MSHDYTVSEVYPASVEIACPSGSASYSIGMRISSGSSSGSSGAAALTELPGAGRIGGGDGYISWLYVATNAKSITPRIRVHFYDRNSNSQINAGNAVSVRQNYADVAGYIGHADLPAMTTPADSTNSDISQAEAAPGGGGTNIPFPYVCAYGQTSLWIALEALDAFTGIASQKWTVKAKFDRN